MFSPQGVSSTLAVGACAWFTTKVLNIRAERVYNVAMNEIRTDELAIETLGEGITSATGIKAYEIFPWEFVLENGAEWKCPRILMMFELKGMNGRGFASVEAKKVWGQTIVELIAIDLPGKSDTIWIKGDEERIGELDGLRSLLGEAV